MTKMNAHLASDEGNYTNQSDVHARHSSACLLCQIAYAYRALSGRPLSFRATTPDGSRVSTAVQDATEKANPLGRNGLPHDMAGPALFLCSRAGAYVNGAVLPVDGGMHI